MIAHNFAGVLVFILSLLCAFRRMKLTTRISVCAEVGARLTWGTIYKKAGTTKIKILRLKTNESTVGK